MGSIGLFSRLCRRPRVVQLCVREIKSRAAIK